MRRTARARRALSVRNVSKRFGVVRALQDVSIELRPGEIHALVGENGSGKSTLVKIVAGAIGADSGSIEIGGRPLTPATPGRSRRLGANTVFQDGSLIPELSIAQNMYVGAVPSVRPGYRTIEQWAGRTLAANGAAVVDPATRTAVVGPGDQQLVEIVGAVNGAPVLLMLDEATSALDAVGVDHALRLVEEAAGRGAAVLFVTHRLSEVFRVAQRITVLRDGAVARHVPASATSTSSRLVELMAGTSVDVEFPARPPIPDDAPVAISARARLGDANLGPFDLDVRRGEILGVAGAEGNGQLELLRALARVDHHDGTVTIGSSAVRSYRRRHRPRPDLPERRPRRRSRSSPR